MTRMRGDGTRRLAARIVAAIACALALSACKPKEAPNEAAPVVDADPPHSVALETKLEPCPATLRITLPDRFEEPAPGEGDGPNGACTPSGSQPAGSYACLYAKALPRKPFPLIRLSATPIGAGGKRQGEIDEHGWNTYRDRMLGVVRIDEQTRREVRPPDGRADHDRSLARDVRALQPGAPSDDAELAQQLGALFAAPPNVAPGRLERARASDGDNATLRRTFYAQRCAIDVDFFVALPSDSPVSELADYVAATTVR